MSTRIEWIDGLESISIARQCELLKIPRSTWYYAPRPVDLLDDFLMKELDLLYTDFPFYGVCKMTAVLQAKGLPVGEKRVRRILREMGLMAIYQKPRLSFPGCAAQRYPYLLRSVRVERPDHVWSTDITYIPMAKGHLYLTAVIDWYSRYVISWELADTLEASVPLEVLDRALLRACPEIFNNDQGSQFTCEAFVGKLLAREIKISWDGRGRCLDNVFVERLWRTVKYEEVYLKGYTTPKEARSSLNEYFKFYNDRRIHQHLAYKTPREVYENKTDIVSE
jgi:putative transposase